LSRLIGSLRPSRFVACMDSYCVMVAPSADGGGERHWLRAHFSGKSRPVAEQSKKKSAPV
jgi:hypothetical protein